MQRRFFINHVCIWRAYRDSKIMKMPSNITLYTNYIYKLIDNLRLFKRKMPTYTYIYSFYDKVKKKNLKVIYTYLQGYIRSVSTTCVRT